VKKVTIVANLLAAQPLQKFSLVQKRCMVQRFALVGICVTH
jgi:hypothetical protein